MKLAGNKIYGVYAGGAIGRCRSHKVNYIGMKIEDSLVQAYRDFSTGTAMAGDSAGGRMQARMITKAIWMIFP